MTWHKQFLRNINLAEVYKMYYKMQSQGDQLGVHCNNGGEAMWAIAHVVVEAMESKIQGSSQNGCVA